MTVVDPKTLDDDALRAYVADREWYHTIELRSGVETPGWFDLREVAPQLPWPDLSGRRCLDVGTFDGFWARQMSGRGAADVLAIDILDPQAWDWPHGSEGAIVEALAARKRKGDGFEFVNRVLDQSIERRELSVYDLDAADVGEFDLVYVGSLLLHLRDPILALERVRDVCKPDGHLMLLDAIDLGLTLRHRRRPMASLDGTGRPWWWKANAAGLARMVTAAGFDLLAPPRTVFMPLGRGYRGPRPRPSLMRSPAGREALVTAWRGEPHAVILARPRAS
ncbi:MAG TPA: class I SAM-dependent methyltransferase [Mycobacteriales bacterium]|nr:class I SAM-dependent methyltransferase [Mycobacteriales bacterium]